MGVSVNREPHIASSLLEPPQEESNTSKAIIPVNPYASVVPFEFQFAEVSLTTRTARLSMICW